jgi:hypothetical protein
MRLNNTLLQWLNTKPNDPKMFEIYANGHAFMKVRKESDYCYTVYYDADYEEQMHVHLDECFDKFCVETV